MKPSQQFINGHHMVVLSMSPPGLIYMVSNVSFFIRPADSRTKFGTMSMNSSVPLRRVKEAETSSIVLSVLALCVITSAVALIQKKGNRLKQKKEP